MEGLEHCLGQGLPLTRDLAFESGLPPETWFSGAHIYLADADEFATFAETTW